SHRLKNQLRIRDRGHGEDAGARGAGTKPLDAGHRRRRVAARVHDDEVRRRALAAGAFDDAHRDGARAEQPPELLLECVVFRNDETNQLCHRRRPYCRVCGCCIFCLSSSWYFASAAFARAAASSISLWRSRSSSACFFASIAARRAASASFFACSASRLACSASRFACSFAAFAWRSCSSLAFLRSTSACFSACFWASRVAASCARSSSL